MSGARGFKLIDDDPPQPTPAARTDDAAENARQILFVALRALSARAATAITNLFSLLLVLSVWVLALLVRDDPTPDRLIGIGGYAVFCLLIDITRRKLK
jgi:hypothetical protein